MIKVIEPLVHTTVTYQQQKRDVQVVVIENDAKPIFQCIVDDKIILNLVMNDDGCWESNEHSAPGLVEAIGDIIENKTM